MFLRVETNWGCFQRGFLRTGNCDGNMVVIGEDEFHSITCGKCGFGHSGKGPLPEGYFDRLVKEGYLRQIAKRPAEYDDLCRFFIEASKKSRSPKEIAGDLLERYEVFSR